MITKEQMEELRKESEAFINNMGTVNFVPIHPDDLRDLLDMADERDRLREALPGYAGTLLELAHVHDALGHPREANCIRGKINHIEQVLYGSKS